MEITQASIEEILRAYPRDTKFSLAIMQDMQRRFNHIPRAGMEAISSYLERPLSALYAMATFYRALSLKPKGKHIIKICDGTACHIRSSMILLEGLEKALGIRAGETSDDGLFSFETVNCLGTCARAPVLVVDETYFGQVTLERIPEILDSFREGGASS